MNHRKDTAEEQAIMLLTKVIEISERDRDALPGSAVKLVKAARRISAYSAVWKTVPFELAGRGPG